VKATRGYRVQQRKVVRWRSTAGNHTSPVDAIEFYNAARDHPTWTPNEIAILDSGFQLPGC